MIINNPTPSRQTQGRSPRRLQRGVSPLAAMLMMAAVLGSLPPETEKPLRKCLLPGCDKLTKHNGGYCCAEHHEQHKRANEKS
jgi:hypothetical protein